MTPPPNQQTEQERLEVASKLEEKRIERAEALAAENARIMATVLEHERRLNALNGHIDTFIREVNTNKLVIADLSGEFKGLRKDLNAIADAQAERDKQSAEDRRSVKQALYALLVALASTGAGAILYELLK